MELIYFTDRGNDNWLIKYDRTPVVSSETKTKDADEEVQEILFY